MSHWARATVNATAGQALAMQFAAAYEKDEHVWSIIAQGISHIAH